MSSILSVSQLNKYIKFKISSDVKLKGVAIKGEISNFTVNYKSGHAYFSLKDEISAVKCIMFSNIVSKLKFEPENGMNVFVIGNIDVYERDGIYQIVVTEIQVLGTGIIYTAIEQLKRKLESKGIFEQTIKKAIPVFPKKIAVVTSLTGAALQDILNILSRRFPIVKVDIFPALVQGETAPDSISYALCMADKSDADTIILARGGGSVEDLMPFNTEKVVLAVYNCKKPIISAVGHETDTTLCDYAADRREPTPTAAAQLAVPDISSLINIYNNSEYKLNNALANYLEKKSNKLSELSYRIKNNCPQQKLNSNQKILDDLNKRCINAFENIIEHKSVAIDKYMAQLNALSPFNILDRGYTMVTKEDKMVIKSSDLKKDDIVKIRFSDNSVKAKII